MRTRRSDWRSSERHRHLPDRAWLAVHHQPVPAGDRTRVPCTLCDLPPARYVVEYQQRGGHGHISAFIDGELHDLEGCRDFASKPVWGWWSR